MLLIRILLISYLIYNISYKIKKYTVYHELPMQLGNNPLQHPTPTVNWSLLLSQASVIRGVQIGCWHRHELFSGFLSLQDAIVDKALEGRNVSGTVQKYRQIHQGLEASNDFFPKQLAVFL